MTHLRFPAELPDDAARYLGAMRGLDAPIDLVDSIMAEVEATPQESRRWAGASLAVLAIAAALLALALILRLGPPQVGPPPTPIPLDELPSAGTVQARISIEGTDALATFGHGFLWITNETTGELVRMDPANGSIASPLQVTEPGTPVPIALTAASVWVADQRDATLIELDPASLAERRRIPGGASIIAVAADGSGIWLLDRDVGQLRRVNAADGSTQRTVPIAGSALLVHGGSVWVGEDTGDLVRFDPASGAEAGRVELGFVATALVADGDSLLATAAGEAVVRVGIGPMRVESRGARVMRVAVQEARVWAVLPSGHIARLDAGSLQPVAASATDLDVNATLVIGAGSVWTTGRDAAGDGYLLQVAPND